MARKKSKKCKKGGVRLETILPQNGRTAAEYAQYLDGRQLPPPYQYQPRVRPLQPRYLPPMQGINRPQTYINRMRRHAWNNIQNSPINDHVRSPDLPLRPTPPSRRRRNRTRSSPIRRKSKSKRSDMKLAIKGTYKRSRASDPIKRSMSSRKAKNLIRHYKKTKKKSHKK